MINSASAETLTSLSACRTIVRRTGRVCAKRHRSVVSLTTVQLCLSPQRHSSRRAGEAANASSGCCLVIGPFTREDTSHADHLALGTEVDDGRGDFSQYPFGIFGQCPQSAPQRG